MGVAAAPLMVVGSLFSAGASLMAGQAGSAAAKAEAAQYEYQAKVHDLRAREVAADAQSDLNAKLSGIEAARSGRGVGPNSPTGLALRDAVTQESLAQLARDQLSERFGIITANANAYAARRRGSLALFQGYGGAFGDVVQAAAYSKNL